MCYPILRSQRNSSRPKRLRFLLSLAVLGAGIAVGAQAGFAQDTVAPNAATSQTPPAAAALPIAPDPLQNDAGKSQDGKDLTDKDKAALRKQLNALMQQRTEMDRHINDLRRQLGERGIYYFNSANGGTRLFSTAPLALVPQQGRKLTDEERRAVQEATRQAQSSAREAMRQAQEAMRQAQKAMEEANRAMQRSGGGNFIMPALPPLPKLNFNFDQNSFFKNGNNGNLNFQFDDTLLDLDGNNPNFNFQFDKAWNNGEWKQWQEKMQKEFGPKFQQQFEQQMRQFQQQMKDWQRQFKQGTPPSLKDTLKDKENGRDKEDTLEDTLDRLDTDTPADAHSPV
jgi:uncharacterized membrane protein